MVERAAHLARLFPAAFVVMGHTHVPVAVPAGDATYVNVGSWAEDVDDDADASADASRTATAESPTAYRAARTHLVIRVRDDQPEAQFCTWEDAGPRVLPSLTASRES
jgi:hypothetical protein